MTSHYSLIYLAFAIIVSAAIGVYAWRHRQTRGCPEFAVLIMVSILWMGGIVLASVTDAAEARWIARAMRFLGIPSIPVALLVFVYRYCGKKISRKTIFLLCALPFITWTVMTDIFHYFLATLAGSFPLDAPRLREIHFWWIHLPYSYILLAASLFTVFFEISRTARQFRGQLIMLFAAMSMTIAADLIGLTGVLGDSNLSPLSFLLFFALMAISIARYQFLGSNPVAYEVVFQTIRDGVIILDQNNFIRDANPAAAARLGKELRDVVGRRLEEAAGKWSDLTDRFEELKSFPEPTDVVAADAGGFVSVAATPLFDIDKTVQGWVITMRDVTAQRREQMMLENLAFRDPLTQLANRRLFDERVEEAIKDFAETGKTFAILFIDLNRFKVVNDTMGHEIGDELLKFVAARLASALRKPDILARFGGDEFAILLRDADESGVQMVAERMLEKVERPYKVGAYTLTAEISIGAAIYPENGKNLTELMRYADSAMYHAKSQGGGLALYSPASELQM